MERARALPSATKPQLHWPQRQRTRAIARPVIQLPVQRRPREGVTLTTFLLILVLTCALGGAVTEAAIALVRWSIPL